MGIFVGYRLKPGCKYDFKAMKLIAFAEIEAKHFTPTTSFKTCAIQKYKFSINLHKVTGFNAKINNIIEKRKYFLNFYFTCTAKTATLVPPTYFL